VAAAISQAADEVISGKLYDDHFPLGRLLQFVDFLFCQILYSIEPVYLMVPVSQKYLVLLTVF
jgi:hypothetical protein